MVLCDSLNEFDGVLRRNDKDVYIVGAGARGIVYGKYMDVLSIRWKGYIDKRLFRHEINGKKVLPYSSITPDNAVYIISSEKYTDEIMQALREMGISEENMIYLENDESYIQMYQRAYPVDMDKAYQRIKRFEGKHKDESCFVIGNGPSLQIEDLEKLKNWTTFACNSIFKLYEHTNWRPIYYFTHDEVNENEFFYSEECWNSIIGNNNCVAAFTQIQSEAFWHRYDWKLDNLYYYRRIPYMKNILRFSDDCSQCVYTAGSVVYAMLQMAVYMGFKKIFLLGVDHTYAIEKRKDGTLIRNKVDNYHALMQEDDRLIEETQAYPMIEVLTQGFMCAKHYASLNNIKIYNATRGGKLEVFERIEIDKIL